MRAKPRARASASKGTAISAAEPTSAARASASTAIAATAPAPANVRRATLPVTKAHVHRLRARRTEPAPRARAMAPRALARAMAPTSPDAPTRMRPCRAGRPRAPVTSQPSPPTARARARAPRYRRSRAGPTLAAAPRAPGPASHPGLAAQIVRKSVRARQGSGRHARRRDPARAASSGDARHGV